MDNSQTFISRIISYAESFSPAYGRVRKCHITILRYLLELLPSQPTGTITVVWGDYLSRGLSPRDRSVCCAVIRDFERWGWVTRSTARGRIRYTQVTFTSAITSLIDVAFLPSLTATTPAVTAEPAPVLPSTPVVVESVPTETPSAPAVAVTTVQDSAPSRTRRRLDPPALEEVQQYFTQQNFRSGPDRFYWYYTARGWKGIKNWKAAAASWETGYIPPATQRASTAEVNRSTYAYWKNIGTKP